MTNSSNHPAVLAGLLGGASWGVPTWAYAVSLDQVSQMASTSLVVQFLLGCMTGVAVSGAVAGLVALSKHNRVKPINRHHLVQDADKPEEAATPIVPDVEESPWTSSSLSLMRAQLQEEEDDPTGRLERVRTGQIVLDVADREHELSQASAQPDVPRRARHAAAEPAASATETGKRTGGRHFAQPTAETALPAAQPEHIDAPSLADEHRTSGYAATSPTAPEAVAEKPAIPSFDIPTIEPATSGILEGLPEIATPALGAAARKSLAGLPVIDMRHSMLKAATTNVFKRSRSSVAETTEILPRTIPDGGPYVSTVSNVSDTHHTVVPEARRSLRDLLVERTKSVREVLAERLNPAAMESIPQIQRADGSVDKIAPTWFDQKVVPALAPLAAKMDEFDNMAPHKMETYEDKVRRSSAPTVLRPSYEVPVAVSPAAAFADATRPMTGIQNESRASYISTHISEVDLSMFPERRDIAALEHEDVWEVALAAMSETIRQQEPVFEDMVGGPTTIDDPEGLEGSTALIPFRKSRRPSMSDAAGYVNLLIADESSRREEMRARQQPKHSYLRVIEGGTSPLRLRQRMEGTGSLASPNGRHFAPSRYAAEA